MSDLVSVSERVSREGVAPCFKEANDRDTDRQRGERQRAAG